MRENVGPYRILEVLGRGGMGVVYRGVHDNLGRQVAVKALAPELTQDPHFRERFFSEARTQAQLQHPNIVTIYDLLEDGGEFFIVMEFVEGRGLDQLLADVRLPEAEAHRIFAQILAALDAAHSQGVIHRDVKSSNVLVTGDGRVKLMDFGIALLVGDKRLTQSSQTIGTPIYMSPEQILRPREVDHRTDIYSAGILYYEMLTGVPPFDADTEYEVKKQHVETPFHDVAAAAAGLPPAVAEALSRALAKDPDERFVSAGEFLRALPGGDTATGDAPPPPPPQRATRLEPAAPGSVSPVPSPPASRAPTKLAPAGPGSRIDAAALRKYGPWIAAAAVVLILGLGGMLFLLFGSSGPSPDEADRVAAQGGDPPTDETRPDPIDRRADQRSVPSAGGTVGSGGRSAAQPPSAGAVVEQGVGRDPAPPPPPRRAAAPPPPKAATPPPAEPDPEPVPTDPDALIVEAGAIARDLPDAIERFEKVYEDRLDNVEDTNRSVLGTADYDLEDQLENLLDAAEDLRRAYNVVASREGLDDKGGALRRLRRLGNATRETVWERAEDTVRLGRGASEYVAKAGSVDGPTRSLWRAIQADLDRLERLTRQAGG